MPRDYTDRQGMLIPHLLATNPSHWPASLVEGVKKIANLKPEQCMELTEDSTKRGEFDMAVRRWATFHEKEAEDFVRDKSGLTAAYVGE